MAYKSYKNEKKSTPSPSFGDLPHTVKCTMGGPGSGRPKQEAPRRSSASKAPKVTLASLAVVVETQRIEIASLRASVELLLARGPLEGERGVPDVGGDGERHRQSELPLLLPPKPSPPHPSGACNPKP
jgi:hypothetical protein